MQPQMGQFNPMQMIQRFNQFRANYNGGNPEQVVRQMVQSGQVNQAQLNQAQQMAQMLMQFMR